MIDPISCLFSTDSSWQSLIPSKNNDVQAKKWLMVKSKIKKKGFGSIPEDVISANLFL